MHSHARTSAKIDDNLILYRSLLPLILSPEIARRSSQKSCSAGSQGAGIAEPRIVHLVIVLFWASLIRRIVLVPPGVEPVVFESVSALPPVPIPSMVTLVAPFRSTNPAASVRSPSDCNGAGTMCA